MNFQSILQQKQNRFAKIHTSLFGKVDFKTYVTSIIIERKQSLTHSLRIHRQITRTHGVHVHFYLFCSLIQRVAGWNCANLRHICDSTTAFIDLSFDCTVYHHTSRRACVCVRACEYTHTRRYYNFGLFTGMPLPVSLLYIYLAESVCVCIFRICVIYFQMFKCAKNNSKYILFDSLFSIVCGTFFVYLFYVCQMINFRSYVCIRTYDYMCSTMDVWKCLIPLYAIYFGFVVIYSNLKKFSFNVFAKNKSKYEHTTQRNWHTHTHTIRAIQAQNIKLEEMGNTRIVCFILKSSVSFVAFSKNWK